MLLTRDVLSDRMAWFLAPPVTAGSQKMESRKMESTVKEGPRKACRLLSSGSSTLQGMLADLGRASGAWDTGPYSLEALLVLEGDGSTRTGCRLSLESRSWMLVRRTVPSAVEMTLLARGRPEDESSRSDTDTALLWDDRPARGGAEPLARVLSALRRLGRPGWPALDSDADAFPLAERKMPRPFTRSLDVCGAAPGARPDCAARASCAGETRSHSGLFSYQHNYCITDIKTR